MSVLDVNGNEMHVGDKVKLLRGGDGLNRHDVDTYTLRKVIALGGDYVVLDWPGGTRKFQANRCRVVK